MDYQRVKIKPLSVNQCWQGRRFKTDMYKDYEELLLVHLKPCDIPEGELELNIKVGLSSRSADVDNVLKPFIDILQKKYGFNDKNVYILRIEKEIVKKGEEYIEFKIKRC